ncbi:hypothetical protein [Kiloniella laminariae]|uniref:hypothetical protein n=1 Tax=Kiloniella laminariae TaxID=454162 RepID=UPI000375613F|nr:hypothetical protein [Kiloniella laminariae]
MNMFRKIFALLVYLTCFTAEVQAEEQADLANLMSYEAEGVSFEFPGNWQVVADEESDGVRTLFIQSSGDALLSITVFPSEYAMALDDYIELVIANFDSDPAAGRRDRGSLTERELNIGDRVVEGRRNEFIFSFLSLEIPHTADYYYIESDSGHLAALTMSQVAAADLGKVEAGFHHVLSTLSVE